MAGPLGPEGSAYYVIVVWQVGESSGCVFASPANRANIVHGPADIGRFVV